MLMNYKRGAVEIHPIIVHAVLLTKKSLGAACHALGELEVSSQSTISP